MCIYENNGNADTTTYWPRHFFLKTCINTITQKYIETEKPFKVPLMLKNKNIYSEA